MIYRIYVEKKRGLSPAEEKLRKDIEDMLGIYPTELRRILRYDAEGMEREDFEQAKYSVFAESPVDEVYSSIEKLVGDNRMLIVEFLPGQFDQRADSAAQCIQLTTAKTRPIIRCATVYLIGGVTLPEFLRIKNLLINPVEAREGSPLLPETLRNEDSYQFSEDIMEKFALMDWDEIAAFYDKFGFAMTLDDLRFVQGYFSKLKRDPTLTELKVIDTYWSDHCRHTTFLTELKDVKIHSNLPEIAAAFSRYQALFAELYQGRSDKYMCLMDVATIVVKKLRREGYLENLDVSEEINACSVSVNIDVDGKEEEWLILFKNETHNHPTEIEPFGGAATCLGGAIRDPLSGRSYVYQAMRVTGASDPRERVEDTIYGKLPQRVITKTAAAGFSSYGNQIGLATGLVKEFYHEGYKAKRLETGYVIGGAPKKNVVRETPKQGDVVILLGGDTGRDGCGGATGSSKAHNTSSVELCGAEVQKGNAPEERKIQRFFKEERVSAMIKRCNDFGAGGVCVAIGELSESLDIYLDRVPVKSAGLTPTELAISESQERMAVVVRKADAEAFIALAKEENLKATMVAVITDSGRMRMFYEGHTVVDIERSFLNTNGVKQVREVTVNDNYGTYLGSLDQTVDALLKENKIAEAVLSTMRSLPVCSTKGLGENFDSTIGAATVLMPFGGRTQLTPAFAMAAKPPIRHGVTSTVTVSTYGFFPALSSECQFLGSIYAVLSSVSKQIAAGAKLDTVRLTFQEYFKKLGTDRERWGSPLSALLGAFDIEEGLKLGAIGGKDSMSGSFETLDVPPTLISFAMGIATETSIRHNAFDACGKLYFFPVPKNERGVPNYPKLRKLYLEVERLISDGSILSTAVVSEGGIVAAVSEGILGNEMGARLDAKNLELLFSRELGGILAVSNGLESDFCQEIGIIDNGDGLRIGGESVTHEALTEAFTGTLEKVFPSVKRAKERIATQCNFFSESNVQAVRRVASPRIFIPVFPGTNCEYDTARAFEKNGAKTDIFVVKNYSADAITASIEEMKRLIEGAQIIAFPGGFSGGDEPDGSGKFIAATFKNPCLKDAVMDLLYKRDGLILGICNGFQALIKLGLVPYGEISDQTAQSPTLSFNNISRHVSTISRIRISSNHSPWLHSFTPGEIYNVPVSHGEGKFLCSPSCYERLSYNGQIATQYVDANGEVTMNSPENPNGSYQAVEGIISPDGRVLGKMGHSERFQRGLYQNIPGNFDMNIFKNGVDYYS